jgi:hypothetical protein
MSETGQAPWHPVGDEFLYVFKGGSLRSPPAPAAGGRKRPSSPAPTSRVRTTPMRRAARGRGAPSTAARGRGAQIGSSAPTDDPQIGTKDDERVSRAPTPTVRPSARAHPAPRTQRTGRPGREECGHGLAHPARARRRPRSARPRPPATRKKFPNCFQRPLGPGRRAPKKGRNPRVHRGSGDGRGGFRTCDLSRVKRALSH